MGRRPLPARDQARFRAGIMALTWSEKLERVTRIELALSAWESDWIVPLWCLTWRYESPLVTVEYSWLPGLMARQWPGDLESQGPVRPS